MFLTQSSTNFQLQFKTQKKKYLFSIHSLHLTHAKVDIIKQHSYIDLNFFQFDPFMTDRPGTNTFQNPKICFFICLLF